MTAKILVVDDEPEIVDFVKAKLEADGYKVITASDGLAALDKIKLEKPDLMILDIVMPKLNGYNLAKILRDEELLHGNKHLPILMLTAKTAAEEEMAGIASGSNVYLRKPVKPQELLDAVNALLYNKREVK